MSQNYTAVRSLTGQQWVANPAKIRLALIALLSLLFGLYVIYLIDAAAKPVATPITTTQEPSPPVRNDLPPVDTRIDSVATVVSKALYFKSLLSTTQQATLQLTYTSSLARKWSNLPCTNTCRNGIALGSNLTAVQMAAALDVIKAAYGTTANQGYDQFMQVRYADKYLGLNGGGSSYDSANYYLCFLNTPSTTGAWMMQFGGHHYAANIAYNGGRVVGATPIHEAVEPISFTFNGTAYNPMKQERDSLAVMLAGLTSTQLTAAKLSGTYGDCVMIPGETQGGTSTFPAKAGLRANVLTTDQKNLVFAAIRNYSRDLDDSTAAVLQALFVSQIDSTYIGYTGNGTSGSASTFLNANANYVRLDGPRVWIELACQNGVVFSGIHYHSVFRDRLRDYGNDLTATTLPLSLLSFDAKLNGKNRLLNWTTANEMKVAYFDVQRSANPSANFKTLGKVYAANNSRNTYTYTDVEGVDENVMYYRLNMVDADGKSTISNIVAIRYNGIAAGISLYPNPAKDMVTIANTETVTNATVRVINSNGKTVFQSANRSGRNINVDISKLPAGSYMLQETSNGKTTTLKFVKQN